MPQEIKLGGGAAWLRDDVPPLLPLISLFLLQAARRARTHTHTHTSPQVSSIFITLIILAKGEITDRA